MKYISLKTVLLSVGVVLTAGHSSAFNPATLNAPPGCNICITNFAHSFPVNDNAGPFGIAFLPDGKVLVSNPHQLPQCRLYLFPSGFNPATAPPNCPSGAVGYSAPAFEVGFNKGTLDRYGAVDFAVSFDGRVFATGTSGGQGSLVEMIYNSGTNSFTASAPLDGGGAFAEGAALDHVSGFVIYSVNGNGFRAFNPTTNTGISLGNFAGFVQMDGLDLSTDGRFLWVADVGGGTVTQFTVLRNGANEPTGLTAQAALCAGLPGPDGIARGLAGTCLENFLFCNTNGGTIAQWDTVNNSCSTFVSGGSRGDFVKVGCNGWLYATQTDRIDVVRDANGGPLFECSNGPVPQDPTPTPTNTPTATSTATATLTRTPTATLVNTATATVTATATSTFTRTSTPTPANTATATPTRTATRIVCRPKPFPNPCHGGSVRFRCAGGPYEKIRFSICTTGMRQVYRRIHSCNGEQEKEISWDLRDDFGGLVANGLYCAVIETHYRGCVNRYVEKVMILR